MARGPMSDILCLSERNFSRQALLLPSDTWSKQRVDNLQVISGIVHVLKSGGRWVFTLGSYCPREICYSRFVRGVVWGL